MAVDVSGSSDSSRFARQPQPPAGGCDLTPGLTSADEDRPGSRRPKPAGSIPARNRLNERRFGSNPSRAALAGPLRGLPMTRQDAG
jgi:hypothetical protein